ncbi:hypothetical protein CGA83_03580 [Salmonella enterica subsp. enterica serovar Mbandaka]|uniref:Uncharacterized protein n=1 Tax=Salmonella enterica subsp. enterica serovar Mbandaka TaxID=192954 RepID=A0A5X7EJY8_SALET|nr:hypothetical protein [Salmonella enterica subsp. enterica serovar Mbandaka]EBF9700548.1 hypothetical protein [Salmonella enterica subsp. enterica serovar Mbandaka]EBQ5882005.1 hypothetical protein [Salmonella enterica subsp. enterica serovar Mbandaka]EBV2569886.1 hypothetical protein [Salmonella enterica subsp. enterica serovar Mbandaka]EBY5853643.1 hypothetical protein [Salmonella enterica subsp. enterica serovar Mbandaka]
MAYHLHLGFENKEYFLSDGAWSTKETIQGLLLPIGAYQHADEKSAWNAVDELKSLVDEILDKVEIEWNDWMTQKPTIIYKEDVKLLISRLKEEFYVNSFHSYLNNGKFSEQHKERATEEFYGNLPRLEDEGWFNFS